MADEKFSAVRVERLRCASDARGEVFEPLDAAGLAPQRNVHVVLTGPDAKRDGVYRFRMPQAELLKRPDGKAMAQRIYVKARPLYQIPLVAQLDELVGRPGGG